VIFNPPETEDNFDLSASTLDVPFSIFREQLLSLLGVPLLPTWLDAPDTGASISEWQLDTLLRRRTLENVQNSKETLESIAKLVHQIDNMPVGVGVRDDVQGALNALERVSRSIIGIQTDFAKWIFLCRFTPLATRLRLPLPIQRRRSHYPLVPFSIRVCSRCCISLPSTSMQCTRRSSFPLPYRSWQLFFGSFGGGRRRERNGMNGEMVIARMVPWLIFQPDEI
jgi:hypothetical protein